MIAGRVLLYAAHLPFLFFLLIFKTCYARGNHLCAPSSCGNTPNISYPFRLKTDPKHCGNHNYELHCENNSTVLYLFSGKYYVQAINYNNFTIRISDSGVSQDNCSTTPNFSLENKNFSLGDPYTRYKYKWIGSERLPELFSGILYFFNCENPVNSPLYISTAPCINGTHSKPYSYVNVGGMRASEVVDLCSIEIVVMLPGKDYKKLSFREIHNELAYGIELTWYNVNCRKCEFGCHANDSDHMQCTWGIEKEGLLVQLIHHFPGWLRNEANNIISYTLTSLVFLQATKTFFGTPFVVGLLIYKWRRRHLSAYNTIEEFLQNHNNLMPIRYSYSDIKKMTGGLKDKLGEGGFGKVYKGKLRSGQFAAIKILDKPKASGEEFISEVATIGRIHHVNIVNLIGFCVEGSKRALVYEFMPNGSLDKHIFRQEGTISLSWEKLYEISLGVARGIEYLHRGCDMQILHFDIKPHNILLDKDFIPKVSDFGLAKLYPTNESIVALTAARGTIGYMAPELFYKNIGHVSYKADVYSFGMLLLEMAGKKKNLNGLTENSSQYFPSNVYDEVSNGEDIGTGGVAEEENRILRKMIVVGLWCIQMKPSNRPSMDRVVEMLEGDLESLQLPPRPVLFPEEMLIKNMTESSSSIFDDSTESTSLIMSVNHESMLS